MVQTNQEDLIDDREKRQTICELPGMRQTSDEIYISKEITLVAIAQDLGISYETVQQNMTRNKKLVKSQVIGFMERKLGGIA